MTLAVWLMSLIGPLVLQALIAVGVGTLTVAGIDVAVNQCVSWLTSAVGGMSSDLVNVLAMSGVFTAMSYIGGGISARLAMAAAGGFTRFFVSK